MSLYREAKIKISNEEIKPKTNWFRAVFAGLIISVALFLFGALVVFATGCGSTQSRADTPARQNEVRIVDKEQVRHLEFPGGRVYVYEVQFKTSGYRLEPQRQMFAWLVLNDDKQCVYK
jgi:hypothetical protein